tara:strand:+ start:115 stop:306 length:192 start_codon:yes stop_codon:yes gene_type:complete
VEQLTPLKVVVEEAQPMRVPVEMQPLEDLVVEEHGDQVQEQKLVLQETLHLLVHLKEILVVMV